MAKKVTASTYRKDPMYPRVQRAVAAVLANQNVVAPVDVIIRMGWLTKEEVEDWSFGRVPYLERKIRCNLSELSRFLRALGLHCHALKLMPSQATYVKRGKGKRTPLRFTKTREPRLEQVYALHFARKHRSNPRPSALATSEAARRTRSQGTDSR